MRQARARSSEQGAAWSGALFKPRPATANLRSYDYRELAAERGPFEKR